MEGPELLVASAPAVAAAFAEGSSVEVLDETAAGVDAEELADDVAPEQAQVRLRQATVATRALTGQQVTAAAVQAGAVEVQ